MRTVEQAQAEASRKPHLPPQTYSHFSNVVHTLEEVADPTKPISRRAQLRIDRRSMVVAERARRSGSVVELGDVIGRTRRGTLLRSCTIRGLPRLNLTTDTASGYTCRRDWQSKAMGDALTAQGAFNGVAATGATATTLTNSGATFPTAGQGLAGRMVTVGPNSSGAGSTVWGIIVSNTGTALTVDQWYDATSTTLAAGTTPSTTGHYCILPGQAPAAMLAVTADVTSPTSADTTLTSEATSNGFARKVGTYSHTAAATTYVLTATFTATGSLTPAKEAQFGAINPTGGGVMPFESAISSPPAMLSGDSMTETVTITIN